MVTKNLGKVAMTTGGEYDATKAYSKLTIVHHNTGSWVSKTDVPAGVEPSDVNSSYWQKLVGIPDGTNSASGSSARQLYIDFTGQGLTDEAKAYNAETFTLLQTQGFSMFIAAGGLSIYPINSAGTYQPGDESIKLQYVQYDTDSSALNIMNFILAQDGSVTVTAPLIYELTTPTEDEGEGEGEGEVNIVRRELKTGSNDVDKNYNAVTFEMTVKGVNGTGPLPMLFYWGYRSSVGTLLTVYSGAASDPSLGGWDFADKTKEFIGFVSPILGPVNNQLEQIRVALYEDGSYDETIYMFNAPTQ